MSDNDEAFSAAFADDAPSVPDATPPVEEEQTPTTDKGTEADAQAEVVPEPEQGEEVAAPEQPEPPQPAPPTAAEFKGMLDEREKRQKFEAEAEGLRREIEQLRQQTREKPPSPEFDWDNPETRFNHVEQATKQAVLQSKVQQSQFFAEKEFGAELVQEADTWVRQQPPHVLQNMIEQPSPYHAAVEAMKRDRAATTLAEFDYDIDKLVASRTAAPATPQPAPQAASPKAQLPPTVRPSGAVTQAPTATEDQVFHSVFS